MPLREASGGKKNKRSNFQNYLFKNNIETTINYGIPLHLQKSSKYLGYKENSLPVSERLSKTMLSLPLYPELSELEVEYTIEKINRFFQ